MHRQKSRVVITVGEIAIRETVIQLLMKLASFLAQKSKQVHGLLFPDNFIKFFTMLALH